MTINPAETYNAWLTTDNFDHTCFSFFGWGGAALCMTLSNLGTAYGTAKSGMGIASMAVTRPDLAFKAIVPIIMAGILSIYGLILAVLITQNIKPEDESKSHSLFFLQLNAGIVCGLSNMVAGYAIGLTGETGVRSYAINENIFVGLILILIFAEVLGLYGLICGIIMSLGG